MEIEEIITRIKNHEDRISFLENGRMPASNKSQTSATIAEGGTIDKISKLVGEGFFEKPRKIGDIVTELKTKDYHFKSTDLTFPLRKLVRKNILKRTKNQEDGSESKIWLYIGSK